MFLLFTPKGDADQSIGIDAAMASLKYAATIRFVVRRAPCAALAELDDVLCPF
jgi:hypothetical protein